MYNNLASSQGFYDVLNQAGGLVNLHESVLENQFRTAQYFSDVYVEDASFLRMDNLTLGYTVPARRGFESLRVFGTVQNVFTLTDYSGVDPEAGLNGHRPDHLPAQPHLHGRPERRVLRRPCVLI